MGSVSLRGNGPRRGPRRSSIAIVEGWIGPARPRAAEEVDQSVRGVVVEEEPEHAL
jgi:hypothetical protein